MKLEIVDNVSKTMASVLTQRLGQGRDIRVAVAFVSQRGLEMIQPSIRAAIQKGAYLEFLVGLDLRVTEPGALESLYNLSRQGTNVFLYCYGSLRPAAIYHPKLYLFKAGDQVTFCIGSSNLTEGGLLKNAEVNVVVDTVISDEVASDAYNAYNQLKFHPRRVVPDEGYILLYRELFGAFSRREKLAAAAKDLRELIRKFNEKTKTLHRPRASSRDLVGWSRRVYDLLPQREFTNKYAYQYEITLRQFYPANLNIRAKIRQQMQVLRDMGLIQHLGTGRWKKVAT